LPVSLWRKPEHGQSSSLSTTTLNYIQFSGKSAECWRRGGLRSSAGNRARRQHLRRL